MSFRNTRRCGSWYWRCSTAANEDRTLAATTTTWHNMNTLILEEIKWQQCTVGWLS